MNPLSVIPNKNFDLEDAFSDILKGEKSPPKLLRTLVVVIEYEDNTTQVYSMGRTLDVLHALGLLAVANKDLLERHEIVSRA